MSDKAKDGDSKRAERTAVMGKLLAGGIVLVLAAGVAAMAIWLPGRKRES